MRTSTLAVALASALLLAGAGAGGGFAATGPLQAQQSTTDTGTTTTGGVETTTPGGSPPTTTADDGSAATTSGGAGAASGPSITFDAQDSSGETVLIQSATLPTDGFVVINSTSSGTPRAIGSSYLLNAGTSDNIRIQLDEALNGSQSLTAVLYADTNGNGEFDADSAGNGSDQPVYLGDSDRRVVATAEVSVPSSDAGGETQTTAGGMATTDTSSATDTDAATQTTAGDAGSTTASGATEGDNATEGNSNESGGSGSGGSGPGFGLVAAVVALLAVALLARRR